MKINPHPFPFIVLEGIDGSGKSTVMKRVARHFTDERLPFHRTAEPTDMEYGKKIRRILDNGGRDESGVKISTEDLQRMYITDRLYHRQGEAIFLKTMAVLSDRDWESTLAYAMAFGVSPQWVIDEHERMAREAGMEFFVSDLTIIIDVPAEEALRRHKASGKVLDYFEDDIEKREKLRQAYLDVPVVLERLLPDVQCDIKIVDGMRSPEEVAAEVLALIHRKSE